VDRDRGTRHRVRNVPVSPLSKPDASHVRDVALKEKKRRKDLVIAANRLFYTCVQNSTNFCELVHAAMVRSCRTFSIAVFLAAITR